MARFDGKRVSRPWRDVLRRARREGVRFTLNSGRRTMREQWALYRQNMNGPGRPKPGRPLTAYPNPNAPHIRKGRPDHALDIDALDGGAARLDAWATAEGFPLDNTVAGEPWHKEVRGGARRLRRFARKCRKGARRMSPNGVDLLIAEEGIVRYAYNDPAGHATFGVGHLLHLGPVTDEDRRDWGTPERPKSLAFTKAVLRRDLRRFEACVRQSVRRPLKQHEFDACVSLAFNIGAAGFEGSTVVRVLNRRWTPRRRRRAANAFRLWVRPSMLKPRRERERRLFLKGKYR